MSYLVNSFNRQYSYFISKEAVTKEAISDFTTVDSHLEEIWNEFI